MYSHSFSLITMRLGNPFVRNIFNVPPQTPTSEETVKSAESAVSNEPMSPTMKCWTFELKLNGSVSGVDSLTEPKFISTLQLPQYQHIQIHLKYDDDHQRMWDCHNSPYQYQLLLDKSVDYPVKISVRFDCDISTRRHNLYCKLTRNLTNGEMVDIQPGVSLPIAGIFKQFSDPRTNDKGIPNEFRLFLNVYFTMPPTDDTVDFPTGRAHMRSHVELSASLLTLGYFADCRIVSNDGHFYKCHKALLSLKSEVFRNAFGAEKLNEIKIDCDSVIADLILPFFYTGQMPKVTKEFALELYRVAHIYHIEGLREFVTEIMLGANQLVSISTVMDMDFTSQSQTTVSKESNEPLSPTIKSWTFELKLSGSDSEMNSLTEPKLISTLQLPQNRHIQIYLKYIDNYQRRWFDHSNPYLYQLLLDKSVDYPVKVSVRIDPSGPKHKYNRLSLNVTNGQPVDIQPGVHLPITGTFHHGRLCRCDKVDLKLFLNVHFTMPSIDDAEVFSTILLAHMRSHIELSASLLTSGLYTDCKVVSNDGKVYDCHKALLCLKSEVFRNAFEAEGMVEAKSNEIKIDCDSDIADLILPYFYTGQMPKVTKKSLFELYRVAHMYYIEGLKSFLADEIMLKANQLVSVHTVLELVLFADHFNLKVFMQFCVKFINANRPVLVNLPEWKAFRSAHLNLLDKLSLL